MRTVLLFIAFLIAVSAFSQKEPVAYSIKKVVLDSMPFYNIHNGRPHFDSDSSADIYMTIFYPKTGELIYQSEVKFHVKQQDAPFVFKVPKVKFDINKNYSIRFYDYDSPHSSDEMFITNLWGTFKKNGKPHYPGSKKWHWKNPVVITYFKWHKK